MSEDELTSAGPRVTRRGLLAAGAASGLFVGGAASQAGAAVAGTRAYQRGTLPAERIQHIVQAEGTVSDGVLSIDISRDDIGQVDGPRGVTFTPAFEVDGSLTFQPLGGGRALFNGDLALKPEETQPFIEAILENGLVFQAFHQHYVEMHPQIWYVHWRGVGDALHLARAVRRVLSTTSTPLPQTMPKHPTTPLHADRLARILGGDASVGEEGVVTVEVPRKDHITIDGIRVSAHANISSNIEFKPLSSHGMMAAAAPDFSMTAAEVQPVVRVMKRFGWFVGCLYNQETSEHPQLYFAHMLKVGDPYELAHEIRRGLDRTDV